MFWKLCKFELRSSYRMYMMFYAILLICSVIIGMSSLPEIKLPGLLKFLIDLTIIIYTAGIFAVNIITIVFIFRKYNQTLYKQQAYLTHTLPVPVWQLQLVKVLSALVWMVLTFLVTLLSVWLMMLCSDIDVFGELLRAIQTIWNEIPFHFEVLLSLLWSVLELIEAISLIYFVINLVHTVYIQQYRTVIGIMTSVVLLFAESAFNNWLNGLFANSSLSMSAVIIIFITIDIVMIVFWNYASVYSITHKMEVE